MLHPSLDLPLPDEQFTPAPSHTPTSGTRVWTGFGPGFEIVDCACLILIFFPGLRLACPMIDLRVFKCHACFPCVFFASALCNFATFV